MNTLLGAPKPIKHGSWSGYNTQKCRCDECRGWRRERHERYQARVRIGLGKSLDQVKHGTDNVYGVYGCRCAVCAEAHNQRSRQNRWEHSPRGRESHRIRLHKRRQVPYTDEAKEYAAVIRNDPCSYCGEHKLQMVDEHINGQESFAKRRTDWFDLTRACWSCNAIKRDRSLLTAMLRKDLLNSRLR